jgi:hypothetical protein
MLFVNVYFLFSLFAVAVPVIIHLFNFRKFKKIYFTNVSFIKDIQLQTKKQSRLKHLIILALRILAITSLVLAFAQPYIPLTQKSTNPEASNNVSIYVDNSFSMEAQSDQGQLVDEARVRASEIAAAYKTSDQFQLLTNDFEGIHQRLINRDEFNEMLDNVVTSPVTRKMTEVQKRQMDLLSTSIVKNKVIYMISDFQKSTADLASFSNDTSVSIFLVPLIPNKTPNIYIDSCWFESPVHQAGQNAKLFVRVKNVSDQDYEKVPLKLMINDNQKAVSSFNLPAHSDLKIELAYNDMDPGIRYGTLEIIDSPVIYDDKFYFSYTVTGDIPVLTIDNGSPNIYLSSLMGKDSAFSYTRIPEKSLDYSSFSNYRLIILDRLVTVSSGLAEELKRFAENGGSILVIPSAKADLNSYNSFLNSVNVSSLGTFKKVKQKISKINLQNPIYNDVFDYIPENIDLPMVFGYFEINRSSHTDQEDLLTMQNGSPFLTVQTAGVSGKVYIMASPLDVEFTSLPQHAIFVPTLYKIALLSQPQTKLFYTLGANERIDLKNLPNNDDEALKVKQLKGDLEFIPQQIRTGNNAGIFVHDQVKDAGHYVLKNGEKELNGISFNYDRTESDLSTFTPAEIKDQIEKAGLKNISILDNTGKNLTTVIQEINLGIRLWKLFIIFALVFLAAEVAILRLWK